jgi:hypothetical protein
VANKINSREIKIIITCLRERNIPKVPIKNKQIDNKI